MCKDFVYLRGHYRIAAVRETNVSLNKDIAIPQIRGSHEIALEEGVCETNSSSSKEVACAPITGLQEISLAHPTSAKDAGERHSEQQSTGALASESMESL